MEGCREAHHPSSYLYQCGSKGTVINAPRRRDLRDNRYALIVRIRDDEVEIFIDFFAPSDKKRLNAVSSYLYRLVPLSRMLIQRVLSGIRKGSQVSHRYFLRLAWM